MPCYRSGQFKSKTLNADYWMGIVESLTFPSVEVEFKQQNLFVGGSRNFTYQYKGIETAGNASVNIVANHGAWLYYFFGKCSAISATLVIFSYGGVYYWDKSLPGLKTILPEIFG